MSTHQLFMSQAIKTYSSLTLPQNTPSQRLSQSTMPCIGFAKTLTSVSWLFLKPRLWRKSSCSPLRTDSPILVIRTYTSPLDLQADLKRTLIRGSRTLFTYHLSHATLVKKTQRFKPLVFVVISTVPVLTSSSWMTALTTPMLMSTKNRLTGFNQKLCLVLITMAESYW